MALISVGQSFHSKLNATQNAVIKRTLEVLQNSILLQQNSQMNLLHIILKILF